MKQLVLRYHNIVIEEISNQRIKLLSHQCLFMALVQLCPTDFYVTILSRVAH